MKYPEILINLYRRNEISREAFIKTFRAWQESWGIDFSINGTADRYGTHITYRGIKATVINGTLCFCTGLKEQFADTVFEFCRKVDFYKNKLGIVAEGGDC